MNRREALELLAALPAVGSIQRADVKPDSVIVVTCDGSISQETAKRLNDMLVQIFPPPVKCVILGGGMTLQVLDAAEMKPS